MGNNQTNLTNLTSWHRSDREWTHASSEISGNLTMHLKSADANARFIMQVDSGTHNKRADNALNRCTARKKQSESNNALSAGKATENSHTTKKTIATTRTTTTTTTTICIAGKKSFHGPIPIDRTTITHRENKIEAKTWKNAENQSELTSTYPIKWKRNGKIEGICCKEPKYLRFVNIFDWKQL